MPHPITIVDAFTDRPFAGNPAGIVLLTEPAPEAWMQAVAAEVNLAETAFLVPRADGDHDLRWFTPTVEVDLCGHATLAAAHALWEKGHAGPTITFATASGELICHKRGVNIEMDFPSEFHQPIRDESEIARALGSKPTFIGENRLFWLVELESETAVRTLQPDMRIRSCYQMNTHYRIMDSSCIQCGAVRTGRYTTGNGLPVASTGCANTACGTPFYL